MSDQSAATIESQILPTSRKQRTLNKRVGLSGIGLHTGHDVALHFNPAPEGTGVVFQRVDLPGKPIIPATVEYVQDASARSTNIGIGDAKIYTVEHVLAAIRALEIDNVIIEVTEMEPPVADGSSRAFVELLENSGIQEQDATVPIVDLTEPVYYSEGETHLVALPCDRYRISYTLHYPQSAAIRSQYFSMDVTTENFKQEVSSCRTFALYEELSVLMEKGLIRGGSLENAVVIKDEAVLSKEGLRFPDEMVRHKTLDLIGDLSLVGYHFRAHIIAIRTGHLSNYCFAKKLLKHITREKL